MNWLKVVRGLRSLVWAAATGLSAYEVWYLEHRIKLLEMSAPQAAAAAGVVLAELFSLYVAVRGLDCTLELRERRLLENAALLKAPG